jgi:hypothetical protein
VCTSDGGACPAATIDGDFETLYGTYGEEIIKTYIIETDALETLSYTIKFRRDSSSDIYIQWYNWTANEYQNFPGNCEGYSLPLGGTSPYWHCNGVYTQTYELNIADAVDNGGSVKFYFHPFNADTGGYYESQIDYAYTPCTPNWSCNGYAECINDEQVCNSVEDLNTCGETYGGDYSEFDPLVCDSCVPSWSCSEYSDCLIAPTNHLDCLAVADANNCGETFGGSLSTYNVNSCTVPKHGVNAVVAIQNAKTSTSAPSNPIMAAIHNFILSIRNLFGLN